MGMEGNISVTVETLVRLAESEDPEIRCAVGEHINTPQEVLRKLAKDEHPDVRFSLAENHNISAEILIELCQDENPYVAVRASKTLERLTVSVAAAVVPQAVNIFAYAS